MKKNKDQAKTSLTVKPRFVERCGLRVYVALNVFKLTSILFFTKNFKITKYRALNICISQNLEIQGIAWPSARSHTQYNLFEIQNY